MNERDGGVPSNKLFDFPIPPREVADRYGRVDARGRDLAAGAWALGAYLSFALHLAGGLPAWAFVILVVICHVRNFDAMHAGFHAPRPPGGGLPLGREIVVVLGPLSLSYAAFARDHQLHHSWAGQRRDPTDYLHRGPWWVGLLAALSQPEQAFVRHLRREGASPGLLWRVGIYAGVFFGLWALAGTGGLLLWILATRISNTASWFIFDWILHHDRHYGEDAGRPRSFRIPGPLRPLWTLAFGRRNRNAVEHHYLHHMYPYVSDLEYPRLADELLARAAER